MTSDSITSDNHALILDLAEWVAAAPRTYAELMDAWRTSCPRLTIWEDAVDRGYVRRETVAGVAMVAVTPAGREALFTARQLVQAVRLRQAAE